TLRASHLLGKRAPDRIPDVDLAALERGHTGRVVRHDLEDEAFHARRLAPVLLEGLEHELDARRERDEAVRPGADRRFLEAILADFLDVLLRHDPARARGDRVERHEVRPRLLEADTHAAGFRLD